MFEGCFLQTEGCLSSLIFYRGRSCKLHIKQATPGPQVLRSRVPMAWSSVGYLALTTAELSRLRREYLASLFQDSPATTLTFPNFWVESAKKAMAWARRDQVIQVGGAPSQSDKAVTHRLRTAAQQLKTAIGCTNYVILQLQTKDNVADAISRGDLLLEELGEEGDTVYVVSSWFSLFQEMPFQNKSKWMLTIELLACTLVCSDSWP